jgi:exodeoxyribonuclease VII small subunit
MKMAVKKFEESLKRLEDIVKQLEQGDLTLDASLKLFEDGIKLSRLCSRQLEEAERRVEMLLQGDGDGESTRPFLETEEE